MLTLLIGSLSIIRCYCTCILIGWTCLERLLFTFILNRIVIIIEITLRRCLRLLIVLVCRCWTRVINRTWRYYNMKPVLINFLTDHQKNGFKIGSLKAINTNSKRGKDIIEAKKKYMKTWSRWSKIMKNASSWSSFWPFCSSLILILFKKLKKYPNKRLKIRDIWGWVKSITFYWLLVSLRDYVIGTSKTRQ